MSGRMWKNKFLRSPSPPAPLPEGEGSQFLSLPKGERQRVRAIHINTKYMFDLKSLIREIPDCPIKGVGFKDITPLLQDAKAFRFAIDELVKPFQKQKIDVIVGLDARGFILAAAAAYKLGCGLAIVRKNGKLPWKTVSKKYKLEYAENVFEMHTDSIKAEQKVLIVDDVLATGGTMNATVDLVKKLKGKIIGVAFLINLTFLHGEKKLKGQKIYSVVEY